MAQAKRKLNDIQGNGIPDYATPLLRFITGYQGRGRPKSSDALKTEKRERKLFFVLMDIRLLGLTDVKSFSFVAERCESNFRINIREKRKRKRRARPWCRPSVKTLLML